MIPKFSFSGSTQRREKTGHIKSSSNSSRTETQKNRNSEPGVLSVRKKTKGNGYNNYEERDVRKTTEEEEDGKFALWLE